MHLPRYRSSSSYTGRGDDQNVNQLEISRSLLSDQNSINRRRSLFAPDARLGEKSKKRNLCFILQFLKEDSRSTYSIAQFLFVLVVTLSKVID